MPDNFTICIYNVHSGTHIHSHPVKGKVVGNIWTHGKCLRFATMNPGSITTWEVGFTSGNTPTEIESLPLPDNLPHDSHPYSFHPTLCRLAITHSNSGGVLVWDARYSKFLLDEKCNCDCYGFSFSPDGRFFMYEERWQIYLWKESPTGYTLHRKLSCEIEIPWLFISPNGESILVCGGSVLQLWHPMDPPTSFSRERHDVPTGQLLGSAYTCGEGDGCPRFTSDGRQVWYITDRGEVNGLAVAEDRKSGVIKLEHLEPTSQPPNTPPWSSSRGYQVVDDRWVLGLSGKRLLWLPPYWRSSGVNRTWGGRFLALLHGELLEVVILELEE
ncbi:hypothetical protein BDM02DRAFT_3188896 [Thelephora ganbajun]|uniref:Uncharacterized protein n=1 Tax=Thelephora ganbajun TaxID=370292 RepID=A0ACB6ZAQ1_THEGA|nr:hypothetical protein BDM02DRAFT_3188896 [Thelephora ganbajun]